MLRNRSRAVTSKQAVMTDHSSRTSDTQNCTKPISRFFDSPRLFGNFTENYQSDIGAMTSPTSILDSKQFPVFGNLVWQERNQTKSPNTFSRNKHLWEKLDSRGIGLAFVHSLNDETNIEGDSSKPSSRMVLFGSQLRIQVPPLPNTSLSPSESPKSPADFGIKTRNSQIFCASPFGNSNFPSQTKESPRNFTGYLSVSEMELSEDYTCVISHGPNPRTTHIFDNCIVGSCCGMRKKEHHSLPENSNSPFQNFLSFCHTCKKNLGQEKDIYMYRGEKAFCSRECRYQEMLFDGGENSELD